MTTDIPTETSAEPVISVTESAAGQIKHLLVENPENAGKHLRVYVEQGGCSGMQYGMVFDEKRADDLLTEAHGICVLVDAISAGHIRGSVVDFSDGLNGGGFKIINPKARQSCGCGKSFEA
jgi:iron-sulfur cluster assembly accessory protein